MIEIILLCLGVFLFSLLNIFFLKGRVDYYYCQRGKNEKRSFKKGGLPHARRNSFRQLLSSQEIVKNLHSFMDEGEDIKQGLNQLHEFFERIMSLL